MGSLWFFSCYRVCMETVTFTHTHTHKSTQVGWSRLGVSNLAKGDIYKCNAESLSIYLSLTHSLLLPLSLPLSLSLSQFRQCQGSWSSKTECITCLTCSPNFDPPYTSLLSDEFVTSVCGINAHLVMKWNRDALFLNWAPAPQNVCACPQ